MAQRGEAPSPASILHPPADCRNYENTEKQDWWWRWWCGGRGSPQWCCAINHKHFENSQGASPPSPSPWPLVSKASPERASPAPRPLPPPPKGPAQVLFLAHYPPLSGPSRLRQRRNSRSLSHNPLGPLALDPASSAPGHRDFSSPGCYIHTRSEPGAATQLQLGHSAHAPPSHTVHRSCSKKK